MQVSYDRENPAVVVQRGLVLRGDRPEVDELCNSTWPLVTSRQRRQGRVRAWMWRQLCSQDLALAIVDQRGIVLHGDRPEPVVVVVAVGP